MKTKRKILILVKNLTSGGAEKQSILLAKALAEYCEVHYVILNAKYQEPKYIALLEEKGNIKLARFTGNILSRFIEFVRYVQDNKITFIFSYLTAANVFAVVAGKFAKVKHVFIGIRNAYLPPFKLIVDRLLCNRFSSGAILNCYSGEEYFVKERFKREKIKIIPNCFEDIIPFQEKTEIKQKVKIITVGRFVKQKDYFTALMAIDKIRSCHHNVFYQIVGYGELEEVIRRRISEMKIESHVEIYINPPNIFELLSNADIYLSTSLFEGTSNSIMEAMNADLPVVATDVGDNSELVNGGVTGFLTNVGNVEQICTHLNTLILDRNLRLEMGCQGKRHLQQKYSMDQFKRRYQKVIEDKS